MASPVEFLLRNKAQASKPATVSDSDPSLDLRDTTDPNNLRSPVTVSRYVGVAGGDYGHKQANFDQSDRDGEQEIAQLMHACGYRGGDTQRPDLGSLNSASQHLRKVRGF